MEQLDDLRCPVCGAAIEVDLRWRPSWGRHVARPLFWLGCGIAYLAVVIATYAVVRSSVVLVLVALVFGVVDLAYDVSRLFHKDSWK